MKEYGLRATNFLLILQLLGTMKSRQNAARKVKATLRLCIRVERVVQFEMGVGVEEL